MRPQPVGDLKYVKATHRSPYGLITREWHDDGKTFDWQIEVPVNTTATVYIPAASAESVHEGKGKALAAKQSAAKPPQASVVPFETAAH